MKKNTCNICDKHGDLHPCDLTLRKDVSCQYKVNKRKKIAVAVLTALFVIVPLVTQAFDRDGEVLALTFESQENLKAELLTEMKYAEMSLENCVEIIEVNGQDRQEVLKALRSADTDYYEGAGLAECLSGLDSGNEYEYDFYYSDIPGWHFSWEHEGLKTASDKCADDYKAEHGEWPDPEYYNECLNRPEMKAKHGYTFYYND